MTAWNEQLAEGAAYLAGTDPVLGEVIQRAPLPRFSPHKNASSFVVKKAFGQLFLSQNIHSSPLRKPPFLAQPLALLPPSPAG